MCKSCVFLEAKVIQKELKALTGDRKLPKLFLNGEPFQDDINRGIKSKIIFNMLESTTERAESGFIIR